MYASLPSSDAITSWGSWPAGTRATTCKLSGSTMASVSSLFSSTSSAGGEGICAETRIATSSIIPRQPVSSLELLIHFMFAPCSCSKHGKAAVRNLARLYYLSRSTLKFLLFSESRTRSRFNRGDLDAAAGLFAKDCRNHGRQVGSTSEKEMKRARFRNRNLELFSNANRRWPRWLTRPRRVETGELPDCGSPSGLARACRPHWPLRAPCAGVRRFLPF